MDNYRQDSVPIVTETKKCIKGIDYEVSFPFSIYLSPRIGQIHYKPVLLAESYRRGQFRLSETLSEEPNL